LKCKRTHFKQLYKKYPKTMSNLFLSCLFGLMSCVALAYAPQHPTIGVSTLVLAGYFAGRMAEIWYCERLHDRKWYRQMLDEEFDKVVLIRQAEQIIKGS